MLSKLTTLVFLALYNVSDIHVYPEPERRISVRRTASLALISSTSGDSRLFQFIVPTKLVFWGLSSSRKVSEVKYTRMLLSVGL